MVGKNREIRFDGWPYWLSTTLCFLSTIIGGRPSAKCSNFGFTQSSYTEWTSARLNLNTGCGWWHYVYDFLSHNDLLTFSRRRYKIRFISLYTAGNWESEGTVDVWGSNVSIACWRQLVFYVSCHYHLTITRWVLISN